jgi:MoxR-like ATPase
MTFRQFSGSGPITGWTSNAKNAFEALTDPQGYDAGAELAQAVNVALALSMPLLITGDPGTGKTQLAFRMAAELGLGKPLRFDTKSSSQANDLFFSFDNIRYFAASQLAAGRGQESPHPRNFVRYEALGEAIIRTRAHHEVALLLPSDHVAFAPSRSVVLVDEIDKAPRDFPNDLLNQIENLEFTVSELGNAHIRADMQFAPIVVFTSNSEKQLPEPFLRRCIYHHIEFPSIDKIDEIVAGRIRDIPLAQPAFASAKKFFFELRDAGLTKKPSTSELLDWLRALRAAGLDAEAKFSDPQQIEIAHACLGSLVKTEEDLRRARERLSKQP